MLRVSEALVGHAVLLAFLIFGPHEPPLEGLSLALLDIKQNP